MKDTTPRRPRMYESNAERQAAYRARKPHVPSQRELADVARNLHAAVQHASFYHAGAADLLGKDAAETVRNITKGWQRISSGK